MLALCVAGVGPVAAGTPAKGPAPATSIYYGRWTVSEDRPAFSSRGIVYKTVDIAPCGKDFCGVSVSDAGRCGPTLFRFYGFRAKAEATLHGHGLWGSAKKNIQLDAWEDAEAPGGRMIDLYLGDGHDFGERSENMPKFHAMYRPTGRAVCLAK